LSAIQTDLLPSTVHTLCILTKLANKFQRQAYLLARDRTRAVVSPFAPLAIHRILQ